MIRTTSWTLSFGQKAGTCGRMPDLKRFPMWLLAGWLSWFSVAGQAQTVGLLREVWEGIGGVSVSDLTSSPDFPDHPTSKNYITDFFEAPTDVLESYGQRMHGYVVAPLTGDYTFWIATDDGGSLLLSTDENPANAREIASVNGWTPPRVWESEPNQRSSAIRLAAGRAYYISALMKEGGGGDNLAVRWLMPNGVDQAPIVGTNLLPFGISFSPPGHRAPAVQHLGGGRRLRPVQGRTQHGRSGQLSVEAQRLGGWRVGMDLNWSMDRYGSPTKTPGLPSPSPIDLAASPAPKRC
jgi:hypothetical protein